MQIVSSALIKDDPVHPVYFLEIDTNGKKYQTAQDFAIFPINSPETVGKLAELQGYNLDTTFVFRPTKQDVVPFPTPCTLRTALERYCDLTGIVHKDMLVLLEGYAQDPEDKRLLKELLELPLDKYQQKVTEPKLTILDILQRYRSIKCPFPEFVQIVGRIIPRYFTIASSNLREETRIHLCVAVLRETTEQMKQWTGLCTGYLETQCMKQVYFPLQAFLDDSKFRLPPESHPLIMITNGCGVAPFRGFIRELQYYATRKRYADHGPRYPEVYLFFGCQSRLKGFLFKEELEEALGHREDEVMEFEYRGAAQGQGVLSRLFCAFSRDQPQKIYIQQVVKHHSTFIHDLFFEKNGYVYLCGSEGMVGDVQRLLHDLAEQHYPGKDLMSQMIREKRIVQESWG